MGEGDTGLTLTSAAIRLGVDKSTVSRLMATLVAGGWITVDEDTRRYFVGPTAFVLGSRFWGASLAEELRPIVRRLSREAGCTAQIGTLQGQHVLYLLVVQGDARLRVVASPGERRPAHSSAMGKVILAGLPEREREEVIAALMSADEQLPEAGPGTIRDAKTFRAELQATQRRGYSISNEEQTAGIGAIAVAISNVPSGPLAVSVTFPASQYPKTSEHETILQHLRNAAAAIEHQLTQGAPHGTAGGSSAATAVTPPGQSGNVSGHPGNQAPGSAAS